MRFQPIVEALVRAPGTPIKLERQVAIQRQRIDHALTRPRVSKDELGAARDFLGRYAKDGTQVPSVLEVRGLVGLYTASDAESEGREAIAKVFLLVRDVPVRRVFALWQLRGPGFQTLALALSRRIVGATKPPAWWPSWLPMRAGGTSNPEPQLANWIVKASVPFHRLSSARLGVVYNVGVGEVAVREVVKYGSSAWWNLSTPTEAREAADRASAALQVAVADRLLRELGGDAKNAAELPSKSDESAALTHWCYHHFGEPSDAPGVWHPFSARARNVMEWLLLRDEFAKIIEEFRKHAEQDRASFWAGYLKDLRDARNYLTPSGVAVCMMVFASCMVIEFGTTNNAVYIYDSPRARLRSSALGPGLEPAAFKDKASLELGMNPVQFRDKWTHRADWQRRFYVSLRARGITGDGRISGY